MLERRGGGSLAFGERGSPGRRLSLQGAKDWGRYEGKDDFKVKGNSGKAGSRRGNPPTRKIPLPETEQRDLQRKKARRSCAGANRIGQLEERRDSKS